MAVLVGRDRTVTLAQTVTSIGSAKECDLHVPSPHLSRRHALIVRDRKGWLVIDFRSTNGVAVNGTAVDVQRLRDGDAITLSGATGDDEVRFEFRELPESPPPVRPRSAPVGPAEAAARIGTLSAAAGSRADLARSVLDELLLLTGADRAGLVVQDGGADPRVVASFARKRTPDGPAADAVSLMPGPANRLRAGEDLIFIQDCLTDNSQWGASRPARVAIPILLVRSAVCASLRVRGTLHGLLQLERALFAEPFHRTAADLVQACRGTLALGLAVMARREGA